MKLKSRHKMLFQNFLEWVADRLIECKDAAIGSLIYFAYGHFFLKKPVVKGVVSFFIGTIVAVYVTSQVVSWFPNMNMNFVSFTLGLIGMKLTEALINQDFKKIISNKLGDANPTPSTDDVSKD